VTRYLLDTNIVSDLMRSPSSPAFARLEEVGEDRVYVSIVVAGELRFGAQKKRSVRLSRDVEDTLGRLVLVALSPPVEERYADLRAELERRGTPIGANDLWIAAQALHDGSVLVTDNVSEFSRVPGLTVENWLRPQAR
jgi:tRNA(fMet)-specific endonuclease VapC